jgi:hypothetical protein
MTTPALESWVHSSHVPFNFLKTAQTALHAEIFFQLFIFNRRLGRRFEKYLKGTTQSCVEDVGLGCGMCMRNGFPQKSLSESETTKEMRRLLKPFVNFSNDYRISIVELPRMKQVWTL